MKSHAIHIRIVLGQLMQAGDFRRSFVEGPGAGALAGPVLEDASYPQVLVAQAISDGVFDVCVADTGQGLSHSAGMGIGSHGMDHVPWTSLDEGSRSRELVGAREVQPEHARPAARPATRRRRGRSCP